MASEHNTFTWLSGCGCLALKLTMDQAKSASYPGDCEADVLGLLSTPGIAAQVAAWDPDTLRGCLNEYCAWDNLSDHNTNLVRMVWIACCEVAEEPETYAD